MRFATSRPLARPSSVASLECASRSHLAVRALPSLVTALVLCLCWSFASVDAVPQAIQNNIGNGNNNMDILNKRSDQFGNAAQQNMEQGQGGLHGESHRVDKQANPGAIVDQKREDHGNPPELQKIVERQKERSLESARRKAEVQKQIEEHEQNMLQKQKGMEEREKKRQERQQRLDELRHMQEEQRLQQQQVDRSNQDDYNKQRAREQKWVEDTQRKSRDKLQQQQQQQQQLQQDQVQQSNKASVLNNQANGHLAAFNQADQSAHGSNLKPVPAGIPGDNNNNNNNNNNFNNNNNINNNNNNFNNNNNILNFNNNNNMNRNNDNNNDINLRMPEEAKVINKTFPNSQEGALVGDKHPKIEAPVLREQNDAPKKEGLIVDSKLEAPVRDENGLLVPPKLKKPVVWSVSEMEDNSQNKKNDDSYNNNNANSNNAIQGNNNNNVVHDSNDAYGNNNNNNGIPNNNNVDNNDNMYKQADNNGNQPGERSNNAGQIYNEAGNRRPDVGGIRVNWDWEDFSIMFDNYGGAEMKVRRSPHPTTGEPWPLPQYYSKKENKVYKVSKELRFVPTGASCDILEEALARHLQRVLRGSVEDMYDNLQHAEGTFLEDPTLRYEKDEFLKAPTLSRVEVKVREACDKYPTLESDESYDLVVKKKKTYIWANEVWGVLRGLETLGQLVWRGTDGLLYIKETVISDYPRFPHRGLHLDTSRHFLFKEVFLDILESMEMNKLNVLHWHIVDDQSFPYESKVYPELSRKGAFHPTYVYTQEDIVEIIEYARLRGIRVLPEFDTPGHTYSWGLSRPELLTQCYTGSIPVKGYLGPIDPSKNSTYRFLHTLFQEIMEVFKDQYLHLGGDEVPLGCWQSNPEVMAFANELQRKARASGNVNRPPSINNDAYGYSMWSEEIKKVYEYYENRLISILHDIGQKRKKGVKYIMWQEVMNNNLQLPNDTIIQVWMGDMGDVMRAISMGYQVLYSTCWYLDHVEYGTKWPKYYHCDPADQSYGYQLDEKKILGGEVAFWSEYFSNENLIPLMWPRASAAAERLWSSKDVKNLDKAAERLSEHRCRMIKRGINAGEISGPGYCLHSPPKRKLYNDTIGCKGGNCTRTHNFVQIEDIELRLSQRGGSIADCGQVFSRGSSSLTIVLLLLLVVLVALLALSRSSSRLHRSRLCKNRSILLAFVVVLVVYFLCYTTLWMRVFEFSGSFHTTLQRDKGGDEKRGDSMNGAHSNIGQSNL